AGARGFVHLAVHQRDLRLGEIVLLDDARLGHLVVEIVAFTGAFSDTGKHRDTAVEFRDVVNQLHDDDRLADSGATERANLAAFQEGADQINDLDAGGKNLGRRRLILERWRGTVDRIILLRRDRSAFVHRVAGYIQHPAHDPGADGHGDRLARVLDRQSAFETLGAGHRDGPDTVVPELLLYFESQLHG